MLNQDYLNNILTEKNLFKGKIRNKEEHFIYQKEMKFLSISVKKKLGKVRRLFGFWFCFFLIFPSFSMNLLHSGKLGGFTQENNTIDSGELDIGRRAIQEVPPGIFWRSQLFIDQPQFLKFNISLQKDALIGVYGRKGLPPSHTQVGSITSKLKTAVCIFKVIPFKCLFKLFNSLTTFVLVC